MRKISYLFSFIAVLCTLLLNIISDTRSDWLVVRSPEVLHTIITVTYGLSQRCERQVTRIPGPNNGKLEYSDYECRKFPAKVKDHCEDENETFCAFWVSASYFEELAIWCAAASLCAIIFGVSTHSRRRRIWRAVAGLVLFHALFQAIAFGLITQTYRLSSFPTFEHARPGTAYVLNTISWVFDSIIVFAILVTGVSAERGHRWAAGNRAYQPLGQDAI